MNRIPLRMARREGSTLIVVMGLTLLGATAAASLVWSVNARARQVYKQICLEKAFYVASAGAERAASSVANGNERTTTMSGTLADGSYSVDVDCESGTGGALEVEVISTGTVDGVSRIVRIHGLRHVSWARYALWYNTEATKLWMVPGEVFNGPVASVAQLHFSDSGLPTKPQVHFYGKVWTGASSIEKASSSVSPAFDKGVVLNATIESTTDIDFSELLSTATAGGLVLEGPTTIIVNGSTLTVTNSRKGWTSKTMSFPNNGVLYARTVKVTSGSKTTTYTGNVTVSAPSGLTGRLTLIADNNILIADHIRYTSNPTNYPSSTDALGLIAANNVTVQTSASNNLDVYAHIICQSGGFGVDSYSSGSFRGILTVFGGIVNSVRNAVGTFGSSGYTTGYQKNYIYDTRFAKAPPPAYPELPGVLQWTSWEG